MSDPRAFIELPDIVRGDTFQPRRLRFLNTETKEVLPVASVRMTFVNPRRQPVYEWASPENITKDSDDFWNFEKVQETDDWPVGRIIWDVEITFENGDVQTLMYGQFSIHGDFANG